MLFFFFLSFLFFLHAINVEETQRPTSKPFGILHLFLSITFHSSPFGSCYSHHPSYVCRLVRRCRWRGRGHDSLLSSDHTQTHFTTFALWNTETFSRTPGRWAVCGGWKVDGVKKMEGKKIKINLLVTLLKETNFKKKGNKRRTEIRKRRHESLRNNPNQRFNLCLGEFWLRANRFF